MIYFLAAAAIIAAIAAAFDLRTGEIPNWLTLGSLLAAPVAHISWGLARHMSGHDAFVIEGGCSLLGAFGCSLVPALLYRQDAIGGGDVKLLAAVGALLTTRLQLSLGLEAEMYSFFAAGIIAPAFLAYEGKLFRTLKNTALLAFNPLLPKRKRRPIEPTLLTWFRFGPAIFVGTALTAYLHWRH
jgi:prepilin peptidase CpaA